MSQAHKEQFYKTQINEALVSTSNLQELNKFCVHIPFTLLKQAVGEIINDNANRYIIPRRALYYEVRSIDEIIPKDIIQNIISFQGLNLENIKLINKRWNKLSHVNEKRILLQMRQHEDEYGLDYDNTKNKTRIISSKRNQLTKSESDMGFEIAPVSRILSPCKMYYQHVIDMTNAINGDRYFIYPGSYKIKNQLLLYKKNLSFIGIASSQEYILDGVRISFQWDGIGCAISIYQSQLRISGCIFRSIGRGIFCNKNSSLFVTKSQIEGGSCDPAIIIGDCNKVVIEESLIKRSKYCIEIQKIIQNKGTKLICKNNIFENIFSYCIINRAGNTRGTRTLGNNKETKSFEIDKQYDQYEITDNDLKCSWIDPIPQNHNRIYVYKRPY